MRITTVCENGQRGGWQWADGAQKQLHARVTSGEQDGVRKKSFSLALRSIVLSLPSSVSAPASVGCCTAFA